MLSISFFRRFIQPGNTACLAALLIALGVETDNLYVHHGLELLGALIALIGVFLTGRVAVEANQTPRGVSPARGRSSGG